MTKKILLGGLATVVAMGLIGCGGGSSAGSDDGLQKSTGKIEKSKALGLERLIRITSMDAMNLLKMFNGEEGSAVKMSKLGSPLAKDTVVSATVEDGFFDEHECAEGGTYINERISGISPDEDHELMSGKFIYKTTYSACGVWDGISRTGVVTKTWEWTQKDNILTNNRSAMTEHLVYAMDEMHKYTTTSASWSRKIVQGGGTESYTSNYTRSGKLELDGKVMEFKDIKTDRTREYDYQNDTGSRTWKISGAISGEIEDFNSEGWLIVDTPVVMEKNQDDYVVDRGAGEGYCNHVGKMTVTGVEHVVTTEVHADLSIDIKYDNEVLEHYVDCMDYNAGQ